MDYTLHAVCVKTCPKEETDPIDCSPTSKTSTQVCETPFSNTTGKGFVGYGTYPIFNTMCFPNPDKLPAIISEEEYNNLIGNFGLDDVQEIYGDMVAAKMVFLYALGTCLVVAIIYNILLKFFAKVLVWVSIIGTGAGLLCLALFLQDYHTKWYYEGSPYSETMGNLI